MWVNVTEEAAGRVGTWQVPPGWSGLIDYGISDQEAPVVLESVQLTNWMTHTHTQNNPQCSWFQPLPQEQLFKVITRRLQVKYEAEIIAVALAWLIYAMAAAFFPPLDIM